MAVAVGVLLLVVSCAVVAGAVWWQGQAHARRIPPDLLVGLGIAAAAGVVFIAIGR